ncbi:MAG: hypothetical protein DDT19_02314 [Syntrophomonadaceae bacterium]|nr:hypothetical protein [Bacillota bacterium]
MKAELTLPQELVNEIADKVIERLKPLLSVTGKADRYMTTKELTKYLGLAYSTIANNKKYLPHTYLNGTPLFKQSEIDAYLEQFKVRPVSKKNTKFAELFNKR